MTRRKAAEWKDTGL